MNGNPRERALPALIRHAVDEAAAAGRKMRLLAFGSSNTERFLAGTHWFDCLELAVKLRHGRVHLCCNAGVGGDTTRDLLRRIETDALSFRPDVAFVTVGGNDSKPDMRIDRQDYHDNLVEIHRRLAAQGCRVVFQTYYAPVFAELAEERVSLFESLMGAVVQVAAETDAALVDHYRIWKPFARSRPDEHRKLMRDAFHVNATGNRVLGLAMADQLGVDLRPLDRRHFAGAASFLDAMQGACSVPHAQPALAE